MPGTWIEITNSVADTDLRDRFAAIMHLMDPRYGAMTGNQIGTWLGPGGPYGDEPAQIFGWFPSSTGTNEAGRMQLALACRYNKSANRALWLMLGWAAPNFGRGVSPNSTLTADEVLAILTEVAGQLLNWMNSLAPANPTQGLIVARRPQSIQAPWMQKLYKQGYFNAIAEMPIGNFNVEVNRERTGAHGSFLELRIA